MAASSWVMLLRGCLGCVVRFGCEGVVRGRRSRERDRSRRCSCRRRGGVAVGGVAAVVFDVFMSER